MEQCVMNVKKRVYNRLHNLHDHWDHQIWLDETTDECVLVVVMLETSQPFLS